MRFERSLNESDTGIAVQHAENRYTASGHCLHILTSSFAVARFVTRFGRNLIACDSIRIYNRLPQCLLLARPFHELLFLLHCDRQLLVAARC